MAVMLSVAKHLSFSVAYEDEILRRAPQDDITTFGKTLSRKETEDTKERDLMCHFN
jgi:hypothetical protein